MMYSFLNNFPSVPHHLRALFSLLPYFLSYHFQKMSGQLLIEVYKTDFLVVSANPSIFIDAIVEFVPLLVVLEDQKIFNFHLKFSSGKCRTSIYIFNLARSTTRSNSFPKRYHDICVSGAITPKLFSLCSVSLSEPKRGSGRRKVRRCVISH